MYVSVLFANLFITFRDNSYKHFTKRTTNVFHKYVSQHLPTPGYEFNLPLRVGLFKKEIFEDNLLHFIFDS